MATRARSVVRQIARLNVGNYLLLLTGAAAMLLPFVWMISTSFKPPAETISYPPRLLPLQPTLINYREVLQRVDIGRQYRNTAFLAIVRTAIQVYTSALLGYVFGKIEFRGRDAMFYLVLSTMIIPFEVYMVPLYVMMVGAKLGNTYEALIIPFLTSTYAIFLVRNFMFTIPNDLIDAARMDGAGEAYIFHRLVLPLSQSVLATLVAFYFMWNWNDFLWPLIVISDSAKYVLPVGIATLAAERGTQHGLMMAAACLTIVPTLVAFMAMQRRIVEGITLTGLKG